MDKKKKKNHSSDLKIQFENLILGKKQLTLLTFLCAHSVEIGHSRYNKSAERA